MRKRIRNLLLTISPSDDLEKLHIHDALAWIDSGADLFRIRKPDIPPKHLVSYIVLFDKKTAQILLIKHKKAGLWLPAGGHVELDEYPNETVRRELFEELQMPATFIFDRPVFLTVTQTINRDAGHTDVSLWYVVEGSSATKINYDTNEIDGYQWFSFKELEDLDPESCDPHMHRFIRKLQIVLSPK